MEQPALKYIPDRVSVPLLITGSLLTFAGILPLLGAIAALFGILARPEAMQPVAVFASSLFFLGTGLPAVLAFALRKKRFAARLGRISGALLLVYAVLFPFSLMAGTPFFISLPLYLLGTTGIWALLKSRS